MVLYRSRRLSRQAPGWLRLIRTTCDGGFCKPMPRRRNASAGSAAVPSQSGLCRENSWSATAHGQDGARAASSRTQAEVQRTHPRATAGLATAATGLHPQPVAGKTCTPETALGECARAVGGAGRDGIAAEKKSLHAQERDTEAKRQRRPGFREILHRLAPEKLIFLAKPSRNRSHGQTGIWLKFDSIYFLIRAEIDELPVVLLLMTQHHLGDFNTWDCICLQS